VELKEFDGHKITRPRVLVHILLHLILKLGKLKSPGASKCAGRNNKLILLVKKSFGKSPFGRSRQRLHIDTAKLFNSTTLYV
jgi:hypothetical protein